jgi:hypothetical protein
MWTIYDESLYHFEETLFPALPSSYQELPPGQKLRKYIEDWLSQSPNREHLVALELGGPGSKLFRGFSRQFFQKTIGVCLVDMRNENSKSEDEINNHLVIAGDLLSFKNSKNVYREIKEAAYNRKVDLIISRTEGGVGRVEKPPVLLDRIIREWYALLREGGIMFIQYEQGRRIRGMDKTNNLDDMIKKWVGQLSSIQSEIEIQVDTYSNVIRLYRRIGSPDELPKVTEFLREK